ncbi:hypothetical protein TCAL_03962 [Tigriopus californicus]|uniref:BHLH domain-containing protein n=1 Tax=Tigriopus californicus TaxID=6832 RepID=A0A553P3Z8_TIGCA|nr:transcription factor E2-alpha-like [Tigriopus californicus]TRY72411.1 hypothetical protein TCAL_03962 [Tigriopus californicus]|eukprot:TCALIF_03962-PA protein Name:"Similar to da Protein daughterless (Drosophila melanogaster)" AED:0.35 eAED:0.35 QI:0/-1/0/1/-1/1/1/0/424
MEPNVNAHYYNQVFNESCHRQNLAQPTPPPPPPHGMPTRNVPSYDGMIPIPSYDQMSGPSGGALPWSGYQNGDHDFPTYQQQQQHQQSEAPGLRLNGAYTSVTSAPTNNGGAYTSDHQSTLGYAYNMGGYTQAPMQIQGNTNTFSNASVSSAPNIPPLPDLSQWNPPGSLHQPPPHNQDLSQYNQPSSNHLGASNGHDSLVKVETAGIEEALGLFEGPPHGAMAIANSPGPQGEFGYMKTPSPGSSTGTHTPLPTQFSSTDFPNPSSVSSTASNGRGRKRGGAGGGGRVSSSSAGGGRGKKRKSDSDDTPDPHFKEEKDKQRRTSNNCRERMRIRDINEALTELGKICMNLNPAQSDKPATKLGVLNMAVDVITNLEQKVRERNLNPNAVCLPGGGAGGSHPGTSGRSPYPPSSTDGVQGDGGN